MPVHWYRFGGLPSLIANVTSPIVLRIAIKNFFIAALCGDTNPIGIPRYWCKVGNDYEELITGLSFADKRQNVIVCITGVDPFKSTFSKIIFIQGGLVFIESIQILH